MDRVPDGRMTAGGEKGFVLILALVTMVAMTLIGVSLVQSMTTDMQLARNEREAKIAFELAEAGISDASARLHLSSVNPRYVGEKTGDPGYRTTAWAGYTFNSDANVIGTIGAGRSYSVTIKYLSEANSEGFCDSNNAGPNSADPGPGNALIPPATWTCTRNPAEVVMYGRDFNLDSSLTYIEYGQLPVYEVTSIGTSNGTTRTIVSYLGESNLNVDTKFAINTNACVDVSGGANTITGSVIQGPACGCDPQINGTCEANKSALTNMNTYLGDTLANIMTYSDEVHTCKNAQCNAPGDDIPVSGMLEPVVTAWEGAGQYEGALIFIDNSGGKPVSISGNFHGEGILIVTGDLDLSGGFQWEGLIYVMGTLTVSGGGGGLNVKGGVMANQTVAINGSITVQYDQEELLEQARQTSTSALTSWKRL